MPITQKLISAYKLWHVYWSHFDKALRYGLGSRIDALFIVAIENIFAASYRSPEQKSSYLKRASSALDVLKFLLQVAWEIKTLDNKKYIALSAKLNEIGRMLGGWQKKTATP
ncbi:MAG TPA: four helix bundle protein [Candidatus Paceibacterota bacterium]|nr:four helix bundle protein [Candidatus Paceibacterota bacterium]